MTPRKILPSPEEYGRKLAERKRKADRVPEILKKLDLLAENLVGLSQEVRGTPFSAIQEALESIHESIRAFDTLKDVQGLAEEDRRAIQAIEGMQGTIIEELNVLAESLAQVSKPASVSEQETIDLEPLMKEIRGYRLDTVTQTPKVIESIPVAYEFNNITRDENGDITGARIMPVQKH